MDDTLTIPEIMIKKEAMCDLVVDAIEDIGEQTGLCVKSINLEHIYNFDTKSCKILINIEVCL
jgi:hypothetical protein